MKTYYIQQANQLSPIFGASSIEDAIDLVGGGNVIESDEVIFMNPCTGSVDFESGWDHDDGLIEVKWCCDTEGWVEA